MMSEIKGLYLVVEDEESLNSMGSAVHINYHS